MMAITAVIKGRVKLSGSIQQRVPLTAEKIGDRVIITSPKYYTPTVTQESRDTATFTFAPSHEGMDPIEAVTISLPAGPKGDTAVIETDDTLKISEEGILSVNTADKPAANNTLPITAAAVHTTVGNIEVLLGTI